MEKSLTIESLRTKNETKEESIGFFTASSFELMQRVAKMLASSTIVPSEYRLYGPKGENKSAISNCLVALNMAMRIGADPMMVMQNLHIIQGRPSWSSQWIIASINNSKRFGTLQFETVDLGDDVFAGIKIKNKSCYAWAREKTNGEKICGPTISIELAVKEGWYNRNMSKWQTMPEIMLMYRAASMFGKLYTPEIFNGIPSEYEVIDINQSQKTEQEQEQEKKIELKEIKEILAPKNAEVIELKEIKEILAPKNAEVIEKQCTKEEL